MRRPGAFLLSTPIEHTFYGQLGTQGVTNFTVTQGVICLRLVPWEGPQVLTTATFNEAQLIAVDDYSDDIDDLNLPWDVIAFDCQELDGGRWQFVLHCSAIEWCFESAWPVVERTAV